MYVRIGQWDLLVYEVSGVFGMRGTILCSEGGRFDMFGVLHLWFAFWIQLLLSLSR